jgi:hypothetical protein
VIEYALETNQEKKCVCNNMRLVYPNMYQIIPFGALYILTNAVFLLSGSIVAVVIQLS